MQWKLNPIYQKINLDISKYPLPLLLLITCAITFYAFYYPLVYPSQYLLYDRFDQARNIYAYLYFLDQDFSEGLFKFWGLNYPYGDFIFYTDCTPLIAWFGKIFSHYIIDITPFSLFVYNAFILSSIPLTSIIIYRVLAMIVTVPWIPWLGALCLPWFNPQTVRLNSGDINLSMSVIIVCGIYIVMLMYKHVSTTKFYFLLSLLILLTVSSCFVHVYYMAILGMFAASFFTIWGLNEIYNRRSFLKIWISGFSYLIISFGICLTIFRTTDSFYSIRNKNAEGYGWINWKLNFSSLFSEYDFLHVPFLFRSATPLPDGNANYLGSFALYMIVILLLLAIFRSQYAVNLKRLILKNINGNLLLFLLISSLILLSISLGEEYMLNNNIKFVNLFNPFKYLHRFTLMVTQFRALNRFAWTFFWLINFFSFIILAHFIINYKEISLRIAAFILVAFLLLDTGDSIQYSRNFHKQQVTNHYQSGTIYNDMKSLSNNIDADKYQAILAIPYFCVGTEDYTITLDPNDDFARSIYCFSLLNHLPLMNSSLGRTPPIFTANIFSTFLQPHADIELKKQMNDKPILVVYNKHFYDDEGNPRGVPINTREPAFSVLKSGKDFTSKKSGKKIAEQGDWQLFEISLADL